jgi:2-polyprenyl-6-methoxyphenol hydroxylase-like FAD-dependent oxidoreductase
VWQDSRRLLRLDLSRANHRYPFMLIHSQAESEAALADALAERGVEVERGVMFARVEDTPKGLRAALRHRDGREEEATVSLLLGADGARSDVRRALGVGFPGSSFEEP